MSWPTPHYTAADREFFARYEPSREPLRPKECDKGKHCWVREGPPDIDSRGRCVGCKRYIGRQRGGQR